MSRAPLPLAQTALSAVNHVLHQQPAARARLRIHAGRCIRIVFDSPFGSVYSDALIAADGLLLVTTEGSCAAVLMVSPSIDALFGVMRAGPNGLGPHIRVEGDVMLAAAVGQVAQSLRWDFEEDLSRVLGDGIAHRIGRTLRAGVEQAKTLRERSREAVQRIAAAEDGPLVSASQLAGLAEEAQRLAARLKELELREMELREMDLRGPELRRPAWR